MHVCLPGIIRDPVGFQPECLHPARELPNSGLRIPGIVFILVAAASIPVTDAWAFSIRVLGNDFFSDRRIRNVLPEQPQAVEGYLIRQWQEDARENLRLVYRSEGFLEAEARVEVGPDSQPPVIPR